jgi:glycosyltransferase involved in cell wall biosynthesis
MRDDVALIVAGEGPYLSTMRHELAGLDVHLAGHQSDEQLARLYASSDLFVFPSRTDTLGQVVMEAQACGLPAIVSTEGGPKETVVDDATGIVMQSSDPADWVMAINSLLDDEPRRLRMGLCAAQRAAARFDLAGSFERFWAEHLAAAEPAIDESDAVPAPARIETRISIPPAVSKDPAGL